MILTNKVLEGMTNKIRQAFVSKFPEIDDHWWLVYCFGRLTHHRLVSEWWLLDPDGDRATLFIFWYTSWSDESMDLDLILHDYDSEITEIYRRINERQG